LLLANCFPFGVRHGKSYPEGEYAAGRKFQQQFPASRRGKHSKREAGSSVPAEQAFFVNKVDGVLPFGLRSKSLGRKLQT
jgi:hypothetical protein